MGWSYRKSFGSGPFRVNFSKSGVSYSVGVKGARVNFGPKGTYVNLSSHGISYRRKITGSAEPLHLPASKLLPLVDHGSQNIASAGIDRLTDTDSKDFITELTQKSGLISYTNWFGILPMIVLLIGLIVTSFESKTVVSQPATDSVLAIVTSDIGVNIRTGPTGKSSILKAAVSSESFPLVDSTNRKWLKVVVGSSKGYINRRFAQTEHVHHDQQTQAEMLLANSYLPYEVACILILFTGLIIWFKRLDKDRFEMELHYDMDEKFQQIYTQFETHFGTLSRSVKIWQYLNRQLTGDFKRNAGAGQLIKRTPVRGIYSNQAPLPHFVTNVAIPCLKLSNLEFYFLPERLLVKRGSTFAAVFYKNLKIDSYTTRFIEDEGVPRDAQIVDYTYRYVNKSGGPDRRFNNNRQLPICAYSEYKLTSDTGIHEVLTTSKKGAMDEFTIFLAGIGKLQSQMAI